jgi:hypothetical protein
MKRVCVLEEWNPALMQWREVAIIDDIETADRWRRNKDGRKFDSRICYTREEFVQAYKNWAGEDIWDVKK